MTILKSGDVSITTLAKPGYKSTEFWGKVLVQLALTLNAIFDLTIEMPIETALIIVGGLEALYLTWRGAIKTMAAKQEGLIEISKNARQGDPTP